MGGGKQVAWNHSRLHQIQKIEEREPKFVDLGEIDSALFQALLEVGPTMMSFMGEMPVTWSELNAYAQLRRIQFEGWEASTMIQMSQSYMTSKQEGENPLCIAPVDAAKETDDG